MTIINVHGLLACRRVVFEEQLLVLNKGDKTLAYQLPGDGVQWLAVYGVEGMYKGGSEVTIPA